MKSLKILCTFILFIAITNTSNAQLRDWLNKKKDDAKQKVNNKIEQKTSSALDKVIDAPEKAVTKKIEKKKVKNENANESNNSNEKTEVTAKTEVEENTTEKKPVVTIEAPNDNGKTTIITNIKCDNGKKKVIALLKKQDGVKAVDVNIKNGDLSIEYSSDGTSYSTLIELINSCGFDADGEKTKVKNSCSGAMPLQKTAPTKIEKVKEPEVTQDEQATDEVTENGKTIIATNIKCDAGKKKVIALLKQQDGVFAVDVNIKTGKLSLKYSSDGTSYTSIIELINSCGFDADGQKSTIKNSCK